MLVTDVDVAKVIPYDKNPRNNESAVKMVADSINEFGFKVPIVVDDNNVIVAGHTRYLAALELGLKKIPVVVAKDLTEDQIKAYRLADNKTGEMAKWDFVALDEELQKIQEVDMEKYEMRVDSFADFFEEVEPDGEEKEHRQVKKKKYTCPYCGELVEA